MSDDELRDQAWKARLAAHLARERVDNEWSAYRSLARMRIEVGMRVQQALAKGRKDLQAHQEYATLVARIEAQRQILHQAMVDLEKSETELRIVHEAAFDSQADE